MHVSKRFRVLCFSSICLNVNVNNFSPCNKTCLFFFRNRAFIIIFYLDIFSDIIFRLLKRLNCSREINKRNSGELKYAHRSIHTQEEVFGLKWNVTIHRFKK